MFEKLKKHWGVDGFNLILILITFACGGSLCGYTARKLLLLINIEKGFIWILVYLLTATIIWPFAVLLVSVPFGQFNFFKGYLNKIKNRIGGQKLPKRSVAIFASGAGSNAEKIIQQMEIQRNADNHIKWKRQGQCHREINTRVGLGTGRTDHRGNHYI